MIRFGVNLDHALNQRAVLLTYRLPLAHLLDPFKAEIADGSAAARLAEDHSIAFQLDECLTDDAPVSREPRAIGSIYADWKY